MAKTLHLKGSGKLILRMNDAQHADLVRLLQEESTTDRDYYIDQTVIEYLLAKHCDAQLVKALRHELEGARHVYRDPATEEPTQDDGTPGGGIDVEWRDSGEDA
jgi:hypothetical protein